MGIIKRGILGGFSGSVANVVGSSWKGIATMRSKPLSVANPKSAGQVEQRSKFSFAVMIAGILLVSFIKPFWDRFAVKMSGYNSFIKTNIAAFGDWSTTIWASILMSVGKIGITPIVDVECQPTTDTCRVYWDSDAGSNNKLSTDEAFIVLVNESQQNVNVSSTSVARSVGSMEITTPTDFKNSDLLHVYLCFRRLDGSMVSTSSYFTFSVPVIP